MKNFIRILSLATLGFVYQAKSEKLFSVDFEDYSVTPQVAKGDPSSRGFAETDLQLRMFPGVNGEGNSLNLANSETVGYAMPGNFDTRQGTVSLWISPQNWQISHEEWQVFFYARQKNFELRIGKHWANYIMASLRFDHSPGKARPFTAQVQARLNPEDWKPGGWHRIDVAWNEERINLYIDGRVPRTTPIRVGNKRVPPTRPLVEFAEPMLFPEPAGDFHLGMHPEWRNRDTIEPEQKTAYDSLEIYGRPLSAGEILAEYEKVAPPAKEELRKPHFSVVPRVSAAPALDGRTDDELWKRSAKFIMLPLKSTRDADLTAYAAHDGESLYVAFESGDPCVLRKFTERDDRLWNDTCFEFHLQSADQSVYQFIVNGNGALFDSRNRDVSWNSDARVALNLEESSWSAEISIPLADLGGADLLTGDGVKADFCASTWDSLAYQLFHWGSSERFAASDGISLGKTDEFFRIESFGDLAAGELALAAAGNSRVKAVAGILPRGHDLIAYPDDLGNRVWRRQLPEGRQRLMVEVPGLYYYSRDYYVNFPLEITHNCRPDAGEIEVSLDFSNAGGDALAKIAGGVEGVVQLFTAEGDKLAERGFSLDKPLWKVALPFDSARLSEGVYKVRASALELEREIDLRIPNMAPYIERVGVDREIPEPWTAVSAVGEGRYAVWGREYTFASAPLPARMTAAGESLLLEPPRWSLNGSEPAWTKPAAVETGEDYVKFAGSGVAGDLRLDWTGELWFDGAYVLNVKLSPGAVEDFSISWRVPRENATFVLDPSYVPWEGDSATPGSTIRHDNVIWLSGHEKGVFFWHKSDANFHPQKSPLRATRDANSARAEVRIVAAPVVFNEPVEYTMVFMGTPSRPARPDFRMINYDGNAGTPTTDRSIGWSGFNDKPNKGDFVALNSFVPLDGEFYLRLDTDIRRQIYSMPCMISDANPAYDYLGKDNMATPRLTHQGSKMGRPWIVDAFCMNASEKPGDLQCWEIDDTMRKYPAINGIYFDVASTKFCESRVHGCGGVDTLGQRYRSSNALGYRKFMMRIYKVVKRNGGSIMLHSHVQFMPMTHAFIDYFAPGENTFQTMATNLEYGYTEGVSPEEYQSDFNWRKAGVAYCMLLQTGRAAVKMPALKERRQAVADYATRALTAMIQHDINVWAAWASRATIGKFWNIRREAGFDKIKAFHGYWESDAVRARGKDILCGWYEWEEPAPYRRLLLISNFDRQSKTMGLEIDFVKLGIEEPRVYHDLWENRELSKADLESFTLEGAHFLLLGIK